MSMTFDPSDPIENPYDFDLPEHGGSITLDGEGTGHEFRGNQYIAGKPGDTRAKQTETPEFKSWFGDSKIVDGEGAPLVCYHGTDVAGFSTFNIPENGVAYFTPDTGYGYIQKTDNVIPVFLSMQKPFYTENLRWIEGAVDDREWVGQLKDKGHDGIIYSRKGDLTGKGPSGWGDDRVQICVFSPHQIKSAIGNSGRFGNHGHIGDSMTYATGGLVEDTIITLGMIEAHGFRAASIHPEALMTNVAYEEMGSVTLDGEHVGHAFRGNQHVAGKGGGEKAELHGVPKINWVAPTRDQLENEVKSEYWIQRQMYFTDSYKAISPENIQAMTTNLASMAKPETIGTEGVKFNEAWTNYEGLRSVTQSIGKNPDSLLQSMRSGNPIPMPIAVRHKDGSLEVLGGATRFGIAKLAGQQVTVMMLDERHTAKLRSSQAKEHNQGLPSWARFKANENF